MNGTTRKDTPEQVLRYIEILEKGFEEKLDFSVPVLCKPSWFEQKKFERGQKFAREHYFVIQYATLMALCISYSEGDFMRAFIYTGKSDTPFQALKKSIKTIRAFTSWYDLDFSGDKNPTLERTKRLHKYVQFKFDTSPEEEIQERTTIDVISSKLTFHKLVQESFRKTCPTTAIYEKLKNRKRGNLMLSQTALTGAMFGVAGLLVTYPDHFGLSWVKETDLEAFVHFWRVIGYLLGANDEHNFCNGSLDLVRWRTKVITDNLLKPTFRDVNVYWEHMMRCMVDGTQLCFPMALASLETLVYDISRLLNADVPELKKSLSFFQYLSYLVLRFVLFLQRVPFFKSMPNYVMRKLVRMGEEMTPEQLDKVKMKKYDYISEAHLQKRSCVKD